MKVLNTLISGHRAIITDDPREQTEEQTEEQTKTLNMLSSLDEKDRKAAEDYIALKNGRDPRENNTDVEASIIVPVLTSVIDPLG